MIVEKKSKLIYPVTDVSVIPFYLADSELVGVPQKAHLDIGHGGRSRMPRELSSKFKNVTHRDIELYINLCEPCQKKRKRCPKVVVFKPMFYVFFLFFLNSAHFVRSISLTFNPILRGNISL